MSETPLHVISSMATRGVLRELANRYETAASRPVVTEAAGGVDVAKRVERGEPFEVVVLAANAIDKLIAAQKLVAGSRVDLVASPIAAAVRAGAARPDLADEDAVKDAVLAAETLSYSTGPSGTHLEKAFERWGILERIRPRIVVPPPGVPVGSLVADGTVELGFQQLSELVGLAGIEVVGLLPPPVQSITVFSGGIAATCERPAQARALLDFMASPDAAEVKRRHGMEPA